MKNRIAICIVAGLWLATLPARAQNTYYWDSNGSTAGFGNTTGTWGTSNFWNTDPAGGAGTFTTTTTSADTVNFGAAALNYGNTAVGVAAGGVNVNNIVFGAGQTTNITLGTAANAITLGGTTPTITVNRAASAHTITSIVSGDQGLTKAGPGTLILNNNSNNYTGKTVVAGGVLQIGTAYNAGQNSVPGGYTSNPNTGSNIELNGGIVSYFYDFNRSLGTGDGQIQLTGGASGFTLKQVDRTHLTFGSNATEVQWGSSVFNPSALILNDAVASPTAPIRFNNLLDLNGADRTVAVNFTTNTINTNGGAVGSFSRVLNNGAVFYNNIRNSDTGNTAGIVKTGVGILGFHGNNTYDGGTTVNEGGVFFNNLVSMPASGTVTINNGTQLIVTVGGTGKWSTATSGYGTIGGLLTGLGGQSGSSVTYSGNVTLGFNVSAGTQTYSGDISNVAGSTNTGIAVYSDGGSGVMALSGANTYSGGTHLRTGTLQINSASAIGTGKLTIYGGTIDNTSSGAITLSTNNPVEIAGNFTFTGTKDLNLGSGTVTGTTGGTQCQITVSGGNLTLGGNISSWGTNGLIKAGNGKLVLSNTASTFNTWIGISGGVLEVTKLANGGQPSSIGQAGNQAHQLNINNGTLRYVGAGDSTDRLLRTSVSGTGITINLDASGTGALKWTNTGAITYSTSGQTRTINFLGDNTDDNTFSPQINDNGTGVVTVNKSGSGTWVLTNNNGFSGGVNVNGGTLLINNTAGSGTGSGAVTVASGAKLGGTGIITGSVTVNSGGTLAPGASIQSLATGALTLNAGSTFAYEIDKSVARSVGGDLMAVTGNLNLAGTNDAILTLTELGATGAWAIDDKLTLISYSGSWNGGLFTYNSSVLTNNSTFSFSGVTWKFRYDDTTPGTNFVADLTNPNYVTMTVIPEPNTLGMLAIFGLGVLARRRLLANS